MYVEKKEKLSSYLQQTNWTCDMINESDLWTTIVYLTTFYLLDIVD